MPMHALETVNVIALWDEEAQVYVATSDDVPGLATEAETLDELAAKLKVLIPELFVVNGFELPSRAPPVNLTTPVLMSAC